MSAKALSRQTFESQEPEFDVFEDPVPECYQRQFLAGERILIGATGPVLDFQPIDNPVDREQRILAHTDRVQADLARLKVTCNDRPEMPLGRMTARTIKRHAARRKAVAA